MGHIGRAWAQKKDLGSVSVQSDGAAGLNYLLGSKRGANRIEKTQPQKERCPAKEFWENPADAILTPRQGKLPLH